MGSDGTGSAEMPTTRSLSAFYASRQAAEAAKAALVEAGLSFEAAKITDGRGTVTGRSSAAEPAAGGLVDTLKNAFAQDRPSIKAEEGRPGHVLTAHVPPDLFERAREILGRDGEISQART